jgi:hypothetical protein
MFEAQLEEDEWHMVWLKLREPRHGQASGRYLLSAVIKMGWHIVRASPEQQAQRRIQGSACEARGRVLRRK